MLENINIKNLAVVENLSINLTSGMSVVTGATGAGKSIIVQAISLIVGARSDASLVRQGANKAEVSAIFSTAKNNNLKSFLESQDIDLDEDCLLRRVIMKDGRSRCYINGTAVSLVVIRQAGSYLIDIHGQNEGHLLLQSQQQRVLLDEFAQIDPELQELNKIVREYQNVSSDIENIEQDNKLLESQKELLEHQFKELSEVKLEQKEIDNIEQKQKTLSQYSLLIETTTQAIKILDGDGGVNSELIKSKNTINSITKIDKKFHSIESFMSNAQLQIQEAIYELNEYLSNIDTDNHNIENIELRFSELHSLGRKYKCQIPELLHKQQEIEKRLKEFSNSGAILEELSKRQQELKQLYDEQAENVYQKRKVAAKKLTGMISDITRKLGMPGSDINFCFTKIDDKVRLNGKEEIFIEVKTNMGQSFKPLKKIVSGGELSRISLAFSVVTSSSESLPSFIFDEVDVGISGAVAETVGRLLRGLAKRYQVICITHLAQVAVQGDAHIKVIKTAQSDITFTTAKILNEAERIVEVSRILGGIKVSDKTKIAAVEMLKTAQDI